MKPNLDQIIAQITSGELFLRLKGINENHEGWHDNESTYDHLVKTALIAKRERNGSFINNQDAARLFQEWLDEDVFGVPRKDVLVIAALVHDSGKLLSYTEGDSIQPIVLRRSFAPDQTIFPSHEYLGGKLVVEEILKEIALPVEIKEHIAECVKQHGVFSSYFKDKDAWSNEEIIADAKSRAEGLYLESLFNMYCDGYTASAFVNGKRRIEELFNEPTLYTKRAYFIP